MFDTGQPVYNPWRVLSPVLQRYSMANPDALQGNPASNQGNQNHIRFFGGQQASGNLGQPPSEGRTFRTFWN